MLYRHSAGGFRNVSNYRHWSDTAIMCYKRGGHCEGCYIQDIISDKCMMKYSVITLVKNLGKPPEKKELFFEGITETEEKIIEAILSGKETKGDIANELNVTSDYVQLHLSELYKIAIQNGAKFTKLKYKLPELVEFIKERAKEKEND